MSNNNFSIASMINKATMQEAKKDRIRVNYKMLVPHEKNHYAIDLDEICKLADTIEEFGLNQDPLIKPSNDGKYTIISGHRRVLAIKMLVEERGLDQFEEIFCKLIDADEDEAITQMKLHLTNIAVRDLSEYDKMEAIAQLKSLIAEIKAMNPDFKGKTRDIIAQQMDIGTTQVQKYLSVSEKADEELKEALKEGTMTLEDAYKTVQCGSKDDSDKAEPRKKKYIYNREHNLSLLEAQSTIQKLKELMPLIENAFLEEQLEKMEKHISKMLVEKDS